MQDQWYYVQNGQRQGPISSDHLARVIQSRSAGTDPLVWRPGMSEWIPFSKLDPESLPVELQFGSSTSPTIQVGMTVDRGHTPVSPGETLAYFTPSHESANVNTKDAKTSMVLGIVSVSLLPFYCCSIFGVIAMIGSLVCGILALRFAKSGGYAIRSNNAVAGRVCGIVGIVAAGIYIVVAIVFLVAVVLDIRQNFPTLPVTPTSQPAYVPPPPSPAPTSFPTN